MLSIADSLTLFYKALSVSVPTFGWVLLGLTLNRVGLLSDTMISHISRLAFNLGLPVMLFAGAAQVDYSNLDSSRYLLAGVLTTLLTFTLSWLYCRWRGHARPLQGIFVQAAFRSNLAIVGVALAVSAYGERGPVLAALPVALMTALYNVLAVWVLNTTLGSGTSAWSLVVGIARNPLIIGIASGVALSLSGLPVPALVAPVGSGLSVFFLPLMLLCIGGAMNLSDLCRAGAITWEATFWRLCLAPLLGTVLALVMGVRDEQLGVLFLLLSSPVAASSFVMVIAARGDGVLAANIVVLTTLLSIVTVTVGFFLLSIFNLVGELA
jgi:predicted permease